MASIHPLVKIEPTATQDPPKKPKQKQDQTKRRGLDKMLARTHSGRMSSGFHKVFVEPGLLIPGALAHIKH